MLSDGAVQARTLARARRILTANLTLDDTSTEVWPRSATAEIGLAAFFSRVSIRPHDRHVNCRSFSISRLALAKHPLHVIVV